MGTTTDAGAAGAGDGTGAAETAATGQPGAADAGGAPDSGAAVGLSGAAADPLAAPPAAGPDPVSEFEVRMLARVQGLQGKFANMRAHLQHAVNGDVRAVTQAVTVLVDLLEEEMTAALRH
jgi:hypothetical protein